MEPHNCTQDTQIPGLFHALDPRLANHILLPLQPLHQVRFQPASQSTPERQILIHAIQRFQSRRACPEVPDLRAMLQTWTTWRDWQKHNRDFRHILPGRALEGPHRAP